MPVNFPDGDDIPAVSTLTLSGRPYSELVVFLDGDPYNDSEGNVLDLKYFEEHYTYEQFIEDTRDRVYLMKAIRRLERQNQIAHSYLSKVMQMLEMSIEEGT